MVIDDNPALTRLRRLAQGETVEVVYAGGDVPAAEQHDADVAEAAVLALEFERIIGDLSMLVRRFCHHTTLNRECQAQAMDYLCRKGLQGSILR